MRDNDIVSKSANDMRFQFSGGADMRKFALAALASACLALPALVTPASAFLVKAAPDGPP